ncbi:hypothetical protein DFH06DRAFT_140257 [Mycena polygramma]|nr:hypothetical protein DFH06DRAFT_140257 [Mycena polygramma]
MHISSVSVPSSPVVARSPYSLAPFSPSTSPLALSTPLPLSPTTFIFPSFPSSSFSAAPQAVVEATPEDDGACDEEVEADAQDDDDDEYYAAHARALIRYSSQASLCMPGASATSPPVRLQRESCVIRPALSSSSLFSAAQQGREDAPNTAGVGNEGASVGTSSPMRPSLDRVRPRRAPPPVPVSVEEDDLFFSSPSISTSRLRSSSASTYPTYSISSRAPPSPTTPTSLLRNSQLHPTPPSHSHSHSPSHTRILRVGVRVGVQVPVDATWDGWRGGRGGEGALAVNRMLEPGQVALYFSPKSDG